MTASNTTTRRKFLQYSALGSTAAFAGCMGDSDGGTETPGSGDGTGTAGSGESPVKIGFLAPLSGPQAIYGEEMVQGVDLATEQVNGGGDSVIFGDAVADADVEVFIEDTEADPGVGTEKAQRLIEDDGVDFITGTVNSSIAAGVNGIAARSEVPFIMSVALAAELTGADCTRYGFQLQGDTWQFSSPFASFILENLGESVFLLGNDYDFPHSANQILAEEIQNGGGSIAGETYVPLGTSDYAPVISQIRNADPDVVWASVVGSDSIAFINESSAAGLYDELEICGPVVAGDEVVVRATGNAAAGTYLPAHWHYNVDTAPDVNDAFLRGMEEMHGQNRPSIYAACGWETIQLLPHVIGQAESRGGADLVNVLEGMEWTGLNGSKSFSPDDHSIRQTIFHLYLEDVGEELPERQTIEQVEVESPDECEF